MPICESTAAETNECMARQEAWWCYFRFCIQRVLFPLLNMLALLFETEMQPCVCSVGNLQLWNINGWMSQSYQSSATATATTTNSGRKETGEEMGRHWQWQVICCWVPHWRVLEPHTHTYRLTTPAWNQRRQLDGQNMECLSITSSILKVAQQCTSCPSDFQKEFQRNWTTIGLGSFNIVTNVKHARV